MVTTALVLPRAARRLDEGLRRSLAVTGRNATLARHLGYWWLLASGFFEPLLYLLSIGFGVGALVDELPLPDGRSVPYAQFVAPAMLAASAMNGALAESTMNLFSKMKFMRLYDAVLATPVTPVEVALGELMWATVRGGMYSAAFLVVMVAMGLTSVWGALLAFPVTLLVCFAFGATGMLLATFMTSWQDIDYLMAAQFALFLFSGTFAPVQSFPVVVRWAMEATPLYHGVELVRAATTGTFQWVLLWHLAYLLVLTAVALRFAGRRMGGLLLK
jgi:lipooligosaccharide transport system permease protein